MSRIGIQPVEIPAGVEITVTGHDIKVAKGNTALNFTHRPEVAVEVDSDAKVARVSRTEESRMAKALHGLTRSLIKNMVEGVTKGFKKELEVNGVGYTAQVKGKVIALKLGYADIREVGIPDGVDVKVDGSRITVTGPDKQKVGQFAAAVRSQRKPEPYNGKGVKYVDEVIIRKQGKQFSK